VSIPVESRGQRDVTVVSSQSLTMLNGQVSVEQARYMAGRLLRECGNDLDKIIGRGWLLAFSRPADKEEQKSALDFLAMREKALTSEDKLVEPLGDAGKAKVNKERAAALVEWCLALFNTNEFLYVD
jgi:hypothetical protein